MKTLPILLVTCCLLSSCVDGNPKIKQEERIEQKKKDSICSILSREYIIKIDSFSDGYPERVIPRNRPSVQDIDYIWACFDILKGKAENFRLIIQCSELNRIDGFVLFAFNIDGKIVKIIPQDYMIHETYKGNYYSVPSAYACDFLDSIKVGSHVKMKISNFETYSTRDVSSEEIDNVLKTYKYYMEMGGKIEAPDIEVENSK